MEVEPADSGPRDAELMRQKPMSQERSRNEELKKTKLKQAERSSEWRSRRRFSCYP